MNGLKSKFGSDIDFFDFNIDEPQTPGVMQRFGVRQRSTYILLDANGGVLKIWVGYIDMSPLSDEMTQLIAEL